MIKNKIVNQEVKESNNLPLFKLMALALAGFIAIMTETMPAGLLPEIGLSLGVKESLVGQLISIYALGSVLAAIPVIAATLNWSRKRLLLLATIGFVVFNAITAFSENYIITLIARFFAGMAAGITWGILVGYAKRIVPPHIEGRGIALVGIGQPIALALGVPLAVWLGHLIGWQGAFWLMSLLAGLLLIWMYIVLPDFKGIKPQQKLSVYGVFMLDGVKQVLFILFLWVTAHNLLYTYIAPYLTLFDMQAHVDLILLIFGLSALLGIVIIAALVDKYLFLLLKASLLLFIIAALAFMLAPYQSYLLYIGLFLWGISFGGLSTLLQKNLADRTAAHADVAQSMLVTVFNLAVAVGGILGAFLLDYFAARSFPWAISILLFLVFLTLLDKKFKTPKRE